MLSGNFLLGFSSERLGVRKEGQGAGRTTDSWDLSVPSSGLDKTRPRGDAGCVTRALCGRWQAEDKGPKGLLHLLHHRLPTHPIPDSLNGGGGVMVLGTPVTRGTHGTSMVEVCFERY